jgi:glycosyltransferase involved in cell wall biosynthesis
MREYVLQLLPWLIRCSAHSLIVFVAPHGYGAFATMWRNLSFSERCRMTVVSIDSEEQILGHADQFDVFFCPLNGLAPRLLDRPTIATLADIQECFFPHYFTPGQLASRRIVYPLMAASATRLLTISEFSKKSIVEQFGVSPNKVIVTYLALSEDLLRVAPLWPSSRPPVAEPFVFYPANLYPHKGHDLLLRAMRRLQSEHDTRCQLVLTGHPVNPGVDIVERIKTHRLADCVQWHGHVPPAALRYLYEKATALVFPSEFEGFGMPLVEAMHFGCPIIATRRASIPEIVGEAALLVDPTEEALAAAIARLADDGSLRQQLVALGRERVERFSCRHTAEQTLQAINDAVKEFSNASTAPSSAGISYVVQVVEADSAIEQTLTSLAYEIRADDEIIVLAPAAALSCRARQICDNLPDVRFVPSRRNYRVAWLDEVSRPAVCFVAEGQCICPGAASAALHELVAHPGCAVVVGEALEANERGGFVAELFAPASNDPARLVTGMPESAAYWRTSYLREHRAAMERTPWTYWMLLDVPTHRIRRLYRTFTAVRPSAATTSRLLSNEPWRGRWNRLRLWSTSIARLGPKRVLQGRMLATIHRMKPLLRAFRRRLSPRVDDWLYGIYTRHVHPFLTGGDTQP